MIQRKQRPCSRSVSLASSHGVQRVSLSGVSTSVQVRCCSGIPEALSAPNTAQRAVPDTSRVNSSSMLETHSVCCASSFRLNIVLLCELPNDSRSGGRVRPPNLKKIGGSPQDGSSDPIPLPEVGTSDKPQVTLARAGVASGTQNALVLKIHQNGVDRPLMVLGIQPHGPHQVGATHGTFLDQDRPHSGANQAGVAGVDGGDHGRSVLDSLIIATGVGDRGRSPGS